MNVWNWLAYLFGIRGMDIAGIRQASLHVPAGTAQLAILSAIAAIGVLIGIVTYARTAEPIRRWKRVVFAVIRLLVYALLITILSGLALDVELKIVEKPRSLVLIDNTLSMSVRAPGQASRESGAKPPAYSRRVDRVREILQGTLPSLRQKRSVRISLFDGVVIQDGDLARLDATGTRTDIPSVLNSLLRDEGAAGWREIFLITDGRNTTRTDYKMVSVALRERGMRLYSLITGEATDFKDVRIGAVQTAPYCRAFDQIAIAYTLYNQGCAGAHAKIEVFDADKPNKILASSEQTLMASPVGQRGYLALDPPVRSGSLHLVVRVVDVAGDMVEGNNRADLYTRIVDEPIKVLYVDNFPRAEFKHVKESLGRDPNISLTTLTRMPGGSWLVQGANLLENPAKGFPSEIGELLKYDVLVLGSISRGYFSADDRFEERKLANVARFVSARGGGLIVLGGSRSYGHGQYQGSPLEILLPFELREAGKEPYLAEEIRAELTEAGRLHPVVQLADTIDENGKLWPTMPELMGCNVVGKARPGAEVLLLASKEVDGQKPILLACQQYGFGRVLATTTYSTFRWRLGVPYEKGDLLSRFWCQAVRYVSPDPMLLPNKINIQLDRSSYTQGDTASLLVRPLDPYYAPVQNQSIRLTIQRPDQSTTEVHLLEDPSLKGTYPAEIALDQAGEYQISADNGRGQESHLSVSAGVSSEEFYDIHPDSGPLTQVARESDGELLPAEEAGVLFKTLPGAPQTSTRKLEIPFRDMPALSFLILTMCLCEWFFRKRSGLA